jgi:hypothetical protein
MVLDLESRRDELEDEQEKDILGYLKILLESIHNEGRLQYITLTLFFIIFFFYFFFATHNKNFLFFIFLV